MASFNINCDQAKLLVKFLFDYVKEEYDEISEEQIFLFTEYISCVESDFKKYKNNDPHSSSDCNDFMKSMNSSIDYCKNIEGPLVRLEKMIYLTHVEDLIKNWLSIEEMPDKNRRFYFNMLSLCCKVPLNKEREWVISIQMRV